MTSKEMLASLIQAMWPLILTVLSALGWAVWRKVSAKLKLTTDNAAVAAVGEAAIAAVSKVEQSFVADLRDPAKAGTLTKELGAKAKSAAIDLVHVLGAQALEQLKTRTPEQRAALIDALVERAVIEVKARNTGASASLVPPAPNGAHS